ncbi:MAG: class B sortase [Candidatus Gastranaerophilales bacterium]|nr:class B sortase [Candidatus Gastranaerophilales bacterium]MCM1528355.1 class B sortase [Bacteroides sp.]
MKGKGIRDNGRPDDGLNRIRRILPSLFIAAIALVCVGWCLSRYGADREKERLTQMQLPVPKLRQVDVRPEIEKAAEKIAVTVAEPAYYAELRERGLPIPDKVVNFAALSEENPDIYAWIYIPDSNIDYPVLQHPTDNSFYLNHNVDGSSGYPGCIYSENYNAKDFSDPNTVLYGHNMKSGLMFAGLHRFEEGTYFAEHPYIYIFTPEKLYVYEVFAACEFSNLHILLNYDFTKETDFLQYLDDIAELSPAGGNLRDDLEVTTENRILTLSTCVQERPEDRYLVHGVLLNED